MNEELSKFKKDIGKYFDELKNKYCCDIEIIDYNETSVTASIKNIPPKTFDYIDLDKLK